MTAKRFLAFAVTFVLAAVVTVAQDAAKAPAGAPAPKPMSKTPVVKPAADMKWTDLDPQKGPGVKIADVWGDHAKGGYGAFLRFPAGFLSPLHTHTHTITIVVISGTYTQAPEGKDAARLGAGSYAYQPGGSYKHISGCDKASDCVLFIESTGPFDLLPVSGGAGK